MRLLLENLLDDQTGLTYDSETAFLEAMAHLAPAENGGLVLYWWADREATSVAAEDRFFETFAEAETWAWDGGLPEDAIGDRFVLSSNNPN